MSRSTRAASLSALLLALSLPVCAAAQQPLPELSLEDLMRMDAGQVFGASERLQPVTEAPASVSFVTAEEIARFGYRTLADILRGVRGMYVTDDRNFSFLGTRGFGKPGDYNSRILLLVNGHRVNDNVFGQAEIGAEFGLDPAMFERVEIIRGPASSLYGDSAFFAVVNVITRTGASLDGVAVTAEVGTLDTQLTRASAGHRFDNGLDVALAGTFGRSGGVEKLYFPAFDSPDTNNGIAVGLDGEQFGQLYGRVAFGDVTITGAYGTRRKDIPTASFNTVFNEQEFREQSTDRHTLLDAEYGHTYGATRVAMRASFDRFTYNGTYPIPDPDGGPDPMVGREEVIGARWSAGTRVTRALRGPQVLTLGAELINNIDQDQTSVFVGVPQPLLDSDRSSMQHAFYLQDEVRFAPWLIVNAGLRYDGYEEFVRVTPRAALIVMPSANQSFKYLFGSAFRAPNRYELNSTYFGEGVFLLKPEAIDTHELVWERYTNDWLRTSVSTYWYKADRLITQVPDDSTFFNTTFVNQGQVRARGLEFEAQMRLRPGWQAMMSYALQSATNEETGVPLTNSPTHVAKARLSLPAFTEGSSLAAEVLFFSSRLTVAGNSLKPATTTQVTWLQPLGRSLELVGSVRNIFNAAHADPVSDQHEQDSIPWNGRTARIGLQWKFWQR